MIQVLGSFLVVFLVAALIILVTEPHIKTYPDALWYTFVSSTSIGFGDICVETHLGRIITVIMTVYEIVVAAMIPGVVITYYSEYLKIKEKETVSTFLDKLEHLPELSAEELAAISERVKKINK
ncbi:MAG: two pore domain potassium channel family protein [Clostridia bacterium]|nr:two pore domain potassium channel family protein [Clostridia bacterium]